MGNSFSDSNSSLKKLIEFTQHVAVQILADLSNEKKVLEAIMLAQQHLLKENINLTQLAKL